MNEDAIDETPAACAVGNVWSETKLKRRFDKNLINVAIFSGVSVSALRTREPTCELSEAIYIKVVRTVIRGYQRKDIRRRIK